MLFSSNEMKALAYSIEYSWKTLEIAAQFAHILLYSTFSGRLDIKSLMVLFYR